MAKRFESEERRRRLPELSPQKPNFCVIFMRWTTKARIARYCAALPSSERIYRSLQRYFGRLNTPPDSRIRIALEIILWLQKLGEPLDCEYLEVGTGHVPIVPLILWLAGRAGFRRTI